MKRSTLIAIIIGLITFLGAVAGTLYYLRKRGVLFIGREYDCDCEDAVDRDGTEAGGTDGAAYPAEIAGEAGGTEAEETAAEAKNHFGF